MDEKIDYENLTRDEWSLMTMEKAHGLRAELRGWIKNRQAGGYDVRLIEGAIAVCDAYIRRSGNVVDTEKRPRGPEMER